MEGAAFDARAFDRGVEKTEIEMRVVPDQYRAVATGLSYSPANFAKESAERVSLVDHSAWTPLLADEDPATDRPETVECPPAAWFVETVPETALEVDTGACDYLAMGQPTLSRLKGGRLNLRFGHGDLDADVPAAAARCKHCFHDFTEAPPKSKASGLVGFLGLLALMAVIGAGTMGHGIAQVTAAAGLPVALFDIHQDAVERGLRHIEKNLDVIGHFHSAGAPGRNELYTGEVNYPNVVARIAELGYTGVFGLEYAPTIDPVESLRKTLAHLGQA